MIEASSIDFNWHQTPDGEEYYNYRVGKRGVVRITVEFYPDGSSRAWIYTEDKPTEVVSNINRATLIGGADDRTGINLSGN